VLPGTDDFVEGMIAMDNNSIGPLLEFMDITSFEKLSDSFTRLTGLATAIVDLKGEVLVSTGWQRICTEFHRKNPVTAARCLESDTILAGKSAQGDTCNVYKCRNGLVDVAVPVTIGNEHVGNLFIGQLFLEPPPIGFFARQAEESGFDGSSYLEELRKVPVISAEQMNRAIEFLKNLTTIIGNTGLDKKRLYALNNHLERRIRERTTELTYSNERLRVLSEASFEGIIISENGVILEANNRMAAMVGFHQGIELVGVPVTDFIAPDGRNDVSEKIRSGYDKPYETIGLTRDGGLFPMEIQARMFVYKERIVRGSSVRDLTERHKAAKEIQALRNILPICSYCRKVRDDKGYWEQVESYFHKHGETDFSHSICPECLNKYYPGEADG
jgi:PAS domain S-box-containing protein